MLKKVFTFLLVVAMVFSVSIPCFAASTSLPDIVGHWAENDIRYMQSKGAVNGYPNGTFGPSNNVTYGEALKIIIAYYEKDIPDGSTHWAENYLTYAEEKGLVPKNLYSIDDLSKPASRKEIAYMIYMALQNVAFKPVIENNEISLPFSDVNNSINENGVDYVSAIRACYVLGIVVGDNNGLMNPNAEITRAEITTIIARAFCENRRVYSYDTKQNNLPTDATNYRKIYAYMPNSFYEAGSDDWAKYHEKATPYLYQDFVERDVSYDALNFVRKKTESSFNALLNVSYKMTDAQWQEWKTDAMKMDDINMSYSFDDNAITSYIQYVKDNKIELRGGAVMNPCTLGYMYTHFQPGKAALGIKGYINYKVISNPNKVKILTPYEFNSSVEIIANIPNPEYVVVFLRTTNMRNELYDVQTRGMWTNIIGK